MVSDQVCLEGGAGAGVLDDSLGGILAGPLLEAPTLSGPLDLQPPLHVATTPLVQCTVHPPV